MFWRFKKYMEHLYYRKHKYGRSIHAPYLFSLVNGVVFNGLKSDTPPGIIAAHRSLFREHTMINTGGFGAGSSVKRSPKRKVSSMVRKSSISFRYAKLLYRISKWYNPEMILELGTGVGVSTSYLASGQPGIPVHSIEGSKEKVAFALRFMKSNSLDNVTISCGELDQELNKMLPNLPDRLLVFMDANHRYEPTIRNMRSLLSAVKEDALILMDDIYWSPDMNRAWKEVISWPKVRVSIDLFQMGILLLGKDLSKADVKISF